MSTKPSPAPVAASLPLAEALARSAPLTLLTERLRDSRARFEAVRPLLDAGLAAQLSPGPVDDAGWSLLAANTSVAAKLRQLLPRLETKLRERGWEVNAIRVRIQTGPS